MISWKSGSRCAFKWQNSQRRRSEVFNCWRRIRNCKEGWTSNWAVNLAQTERVIWFRGSRTIIQGHYTPKWSSQGKEDPSLWATGLQPWLHLRISRSLWTTRCQGPQPAQILTKLVWGWPGCQKTLTWPPHTALMENPRGWQTWVHGLDFCNQTQLRRLCS